MKKFTKLSAIIVSVILALSAFGFVGCAPTEVKKPDPTPVVQSITLKYDNANVNQTLSVDVSRGTITLTASVIKDAGADGTVTYESSDTSVATVANDGAVTLLKKGESVITAKAGDKSTSIVLVVGDEFSASGTTYNVTVVGGTADKSKAAEGEVVILTPTIPDHQEFVEWQYSVDANDLVLNGNAFEMPDAAITVTAVYKVKLYTLNVVGATFDSVDYQGADGGNIKDGSLAKYDMTTYQLPYDTPVTLEGITPASGETFVAWDFGQQGNRVGELGNDSYTFNMPDETTTVWANYATLTNTIFTAESIGGYTAETASIDGLNGYKLTAGSVSANSGFPENIGGSVFSTADNAKMIKSVFKNEGTEEVKVEIYPSYYGNTSSSGVVTVPAGQTVTHYFSITTIVNNPSWGIRFAKSTSSALNLTFGAGFAELYPEGDPFALNKAEFVEVEGYKATNNGRPDGTSGDYQLWYSSNFGHPNSPRFTNNANGTTVMATRDQYVGTKPGFFIYSQITNMGAFDANKPTKTIYVQLTCASNTPNIEYEVLVTKNVTFNKSATSSGNNTTNTGSDTVLTNVLASKKVTFTVMGQQIVVKLEVPRTASDTNYAFVIRPTVKNSAYAYNVNLKMAYNDVFGYEDAQ